MINLDFAYNDINKSTGEAEGDNTLATDMALNNFLTNIENAKGLLINITGGKDLTLEVDEIIKKITAEIDSEPEFI